MKSGANSLANGIEAKDRVERVATRYSLGVSTLALAAALGAGSALADDYTIPPNLTEELAIVAGDTVTVGAGGTLDTTLNATPAEDGIHATGVGDVTVTVGVGGILTGDQDGIDGGDLTASGLTTVLNAGAITGTSGLGVRANIAHVTNTATGTITGDTGILAMEAVIDNSGGITGTTTGIDATGATVTNQATGMITGTDDTGVFSTGSVYLNNAGQVLGGRNGVWIGGPGLATVVNSGSVSGTRVGSAGGAPESGIVSDGDGDVTNLASGSILGDDYGIFVEGMLTLDNAGMITGTRVGGVHAVTYADIVNSGGITGTSAGVFSGGELHLENLGTGMISGAVGAGGTTAYITNWGTIAGETIGAGGGFLDLWNAGTVSASDAAGSGAFASSHADVHNTATGDISGARYGILSEDTVKVFNAGMISGDRGAIHSVGDADITNEGSIISDRTAIVSETGGVMLDNRGVVQGDEGGVRGTDVVVHNEGLIDGAGSSSRGVEAFGTLDLFNAGTISGAIGIRGSDAGSRVTNAGLIMGREDDGVTTAISFGGSDDLLELLPGSVIIGGVIVRGGTDTADLSNGWSYDLHFSGMSNILPEVAITNGMPTAIIDGNRVIAADSTVLTNADAALFDLTGSILGGVNAAAGGWPGTENGGGVMPLAYGPDDAALADMPSNPDPTRHLWAQVFGAGRSQAEDLPTSGGYSNILGGAMAGGDMAVGNGDSRFGLFGGGAYGQFQVAHDSQTVDTATGFGGGYWRWRSGDAFAGLSVVAGGVSNNLRRTVANNDLDDGLETATASYGGWFVNPEATVGHVFGPSDKSTVVSLSIGYAGEWLGGYTETGVEHPMTVDARSLQLVTARAELGVPRSYMASDGAEITMRARAGVEGWVNVGGDVTGLLAGVPFILGDGSNEVLGFLGLSMARRVGTFTTFANLEGALNFAGAVQGSAQAGAKIGFLSSAAPRHSRTPALPGQARHGVDSVVRGQVRKRIVCGSRRPDGEAFIWCGRGRGAMWL